MANIRIDPLTQADRLLHPEMTDTAFGEMLAASRARQYQGRFYQALIIRRNGDAVGRMSLLGGEEGAASEGIEVFETYRRQGVGAAALALLADHASRLGFRSLTAQIRTDNTASLALHEKLGFAVTRTYVNRRGREVHDLLLMLKGRTPMHHEMSLRSGPFAAIASGRKRYELRLNDEKRRAIRVGDTITFRNLADGAALTVRVTSLHPFLNFAALYAAMPLTECGYTETDAAKADPRDMESCYPPEKQARYGVLAIGIEVIRT